MTKPYFFLSCLTVFLASGFTSEMSLMCSAVLTIMFFVVAEIVEDEAAEAKARMAAAAVEAAVAAAVDSACKSCLDSGNSAEDVSFMRHSFFSDGVSVPVSATAAASDGEAVIV